MARYKDSLLGGLSGKIGPVVMYVRNGTQVVRSNPKQRDPKSPKQLAHRMKFALVNQRLSPLKTIIDVGYKNSDKTYRTLIGEAYREAIMGEYPDFSLDYSKIQISEGNIALPRHVTIEMGENPDTVNFRWDPAIVREVRTSRDNDQVNIVCLDATGKYAFHELNAARRSHGSASLEMPHASWHPASSHFWMFLTSYDSRFHSNSLYISFK